MCKNTITHRAVIETLNKLANMPKVSVQVPQDNADSTPYPEALKYANRYRNLSKNFDMPWKEAAKRYWKNGHAKLWDKNGTLKPGVALGGILAVKM